MYRKASAEPYTLVGIQTTGSLFCYCYNQNNMSSFLFLMLSKHFKKFANNLNCVMDCFRKWILKADCFPLELLGVQALYFHCQDGRTKTSHIYVADII